MKDIFYIIKDEIVSKLDRNLVIYNANLLTDKWLVDIKCSVKWSRTFKTVTDSLGNIFTIVSVNYDTNQIGLGIIYDVNDNVIEPIGTLVLELPEFFIGTPIRTNEEWLLFSSNEMKKTPFIWMLEPTSENILDYKTDIERKSDIHLVLLDSNNSVQWQTKDVHDNRLQALYNLVFEIREAIRENIAYFDAFEQTYDIKNFTRFGSESAGGFSANIIDADLTGIEMRFNLSILKQACNC